MALPLSCALKVQRRETVLITPSEPTPYELKYLSDIDDQVYHRFHIPVVQFYRNNDVMEGKDPAEVIQQAVALALVQYYPFAGRLREGPSGKLIVECTGEGVLFTEANANVTLDHFGDSPLPPFPAIDELLYHVPGSTGILHAPLLLIQVTRLLCGGFIFALRLNHTMSDAPGLTQFMNAVGEIARGIPVPSVKAVWCRELLIARDVPDVPCIQKKDGELPDVNNIMPVRPNDLVAKSFFFGSAEVSRLRHHLPSHLRSSSSTTTFEIVTACLWKCRIIALEPNDPDEEVRVHCIVNARNKFSPTLPVGYYGNAFASSAAETKVGDLCEKPLGYALELVKKAKAGVTDEYMRSLLLRLSDQPKHPRSIKLLGTFSVSDVRRVGFGEVDFGWSKPIYGGPATVDLASYPGITCFFVATENDKGEAGLAATINLPRPAMRRFMMELENVMKKDPTAL